MEPTAEELAFLERVKESDYTVSAMGWEVYALRHLRVVESELTGISHYGKGIKESYLYRIKHSLKAVCLAVDQIELLSQGKTLKYGLDIHAVEAMPDEVIDDNKSILEWAKTSHIVPN